MSNTIKYFGMIAEKVGASSEVDAVAGKTLEEFTELLVNKYPELGKNSFRIAVNQSFQEPLTLIEIGDELAVLPPFSGG